MTKERRLGRGLEALLGRAAGEEVVQVRDASNNAQAPAPHPYRVHAPAPEVEDAEPQDGDLLSLSVYEIDSNPYQPRRTFDDAEIDALADSLEAHGLIQPVLVRRIGERYQLIAGERRLRSAIKAGWSEIPARLRQADDRLVAEIAIVENLQRRDLNAMEKAVSFQNYLEKYRCTQDELAKRLMVDRSTVSNLIRLLELPQTVQDAVRVGAISQGHARALLPLGDEQEQLQACKRIEAEGLSVRATEEMVNEIIRHGDGDAPTGSGGGTGNSDARPAGSSTGEREVPGKRDQSASKYIGSLEQEFRTALGTKVDIKQVAKDKGRIVIHFNTNAEFDRIREHVCGTGVVKEQAG